MLQIWIRIYLTNPKIYADKKLFRAGLAGMALVQSPLS